MDLIVPVMSVGQLGEGGSKIFHTGGVAVHDHGADLREGEGLELGVEGRQSVKDLIRFVCPKVF